MSRLETVELRERLQTISGVLEEVKSIRAGELNALFSAFSSSPRFAYLEYAGVEDAAKAIRRKPISISHCTLSV
jgi:hypothetical protein